MGRVTYDWAHQVERKDWDQSMVANGPVLCRRCGLPVYPDRLCHLNRDQAKFDLGHPDAGQDGKEPEHRCCNRRAGQAAGKADQYQPASEEW